MTHAHVLLRLSAYLEADLSPAEEASLEAHLAECAGCAAELRALRRAIELLHALPAPEAPKGLGDTVIQRLRSGEGRPTPWGWPFFQLFGGESWLGGFAPVAAALGVGAVAWLLTPDMLPPTVRTVREAAATPRFEAPAPARASVAASTLTLTAGEKAGTAAPPASRPGSLPTMQVCLEQARVGGGGSDGCAGWYAWFVAKALEDAGGFADEVDRLPPKARGPWLGRLSEFAQRSGSAHLVGAQLRSSRDPGAVRIARRFERGGGPIRAAAWQGR
jgi:hypothetical protein